MGEKGPSDESSEKQFMHDRSTAETAQDMRKMIEDVRSEVTALEARINTLTDLDEITAANTELSALKENVSENTLILEKYLTEVHDGETLN